MYKRSGLISFMLKILMEKGVSATWNYSVIICFHITIYIYKYIYNVCARVGVCVYIQNVRICLSLFCSACQITLFLNIKSYIMIKINNKK